jgi:stage II sporulation protein AB (anti-sigma F factor)
MNEIKLIFPSDSRNESYARYAVTAFVAQLDPTTEEIADIRTAVSEAVTNGIIHGYRGTKGFLQVDVRLYEDRTVVIVVKDKGHGIADVEQARQPLFTTDGSGERGGMGFAIMESFSDKLTVRSKPGKGTTVTMTKRLS